MRLPNPRYVGDGVYARHDGHQLVIETSNGVFVRDRIALDGNSLSALQEYAQYAGAFYGTGQHQVEPGCELCGKDLRYNDNPIEGAVNGEIYQVYHQEVQHEVRLCRECAVGIGLDRLVGIIEKRPPAPSAS